MSLPTSPERSPGIVRRQRAVLSGGEVRSLESVLATHRLAERSSRPPNYAIENRALLGLARTLSGAPQEMLGTLVREAVALCRPDGNATAGVSLLEQDPKTSADVFRWTALAGRLEQHVGGSTPREFSPCGVCLDAGQPVLFERPDLHFTYLLASGIPSVEGLVLPFYVDGEPAGTIWILSHDDARLFDVEDVRVMTSLAEFTGAAYSLNRARGAAERANRAKSEFLSSVSHELRTPLNSISGYVELIKMGVHGPLTEGQREALDRIGRSQRHLLGLINDILDLSQIEAGRVDYAVEVVPLASVLAETCETVAPLLSAKHLVCDLQPLSLNDGAQAIRGDPERVRQILLNLITNSIKFTPEHGRITIGARVRPDDESAVCIDVRDTGVGIAPADLARIFEPFVQLGTRTHGSQQGVGLGLSISRDLARAMGGDLEVDSVLGQWTKFTLTLPKA